MRLKTIKILVYIIPFLSLHAQNGYTVEMNIKNETAEKITKKETEIGFNIYNKIDSKNEIVNTVKYKNNTINYSLETYDLQDNLNQFSSLEYDLEFAHQLTNKTKMIFEFNPKANFETNIGISDIVVLGGVEIEYPFNAANSIKIGLKRMTPFGKAEILPSFSLKHQLNKKTFVEIGFPRTILSYSNNIRNTFRFTNSFSGDFYNLDHPVAFDNSNTTTKAVFSQISSTIEYERNMNSNWFVSFKGGFDFNKKYTLTNNNENTTYDFNINKGYILNIGIKYKH